MIRRVVLDTNVFVAAGFNPRSHAAQLLRAAREGALSLAWHAETRAEVLYVLGRIPPLRHLDVAGLFRPDAAYEAPLDPTAYAFIPDPGDRIFAALAESAGAALVTNDAHLLDHRHSLRAPVLTPRACWEAWSTGAGPGGHASGSASRWREHDDG